MTIKITPNEPLKCVFMGLPAIYAPIYEGGFELRIRRIDIPLTGHDLSSLHNHWGIDKWGEEGEVSLFIDSLDKLDSFEPMMITKDTTL